MTAPSINDVLIEKNESANNISTVVRNTEVDEYMTPSRCPDWGQPGDRHCYQCGEPVDDVNLMCFGEYDDPLAYVLGKCEICGAPAYQILEDCPVCDGPVYEFKDSFACYHSISGACDFSISIARMHELELWPCNINIKHLIDGELRIGHCNLNGRLVKITEFEIIRLESGEWDIAVSEGPFID